MKRVIVQCFFLFAALADMRAQPDPRMVKEAGLPVVMAGVLSTLEYVEKAEKGATLDRSLEWGKIRGDSDEYELNFSDFRYAYLFYYDDEEDDTDDRKFCRVILNGKLRYTESGRLNGRLSVGGEAGISSVVFDNLSAQESSVSGGVTVDGVPYTQDELTRIIDSVDYYFQSGFPLVISWETECTVSGLFIFMKTAELAWEDGEGGSVLESLLHTKAEDLPPPGTRTAREDGTISAIVKAGGIEFSYDGFSVDSDDYILFTVDGTVFMSTEHLEQEGGDIESLTLRLNGTVSMTGLPHISRVELNGFSVRFSESDSVMFTGSGSAVIDGKEYPAAGILDSLLRLFNF